MRCISPKAKQYCAFFEGLAREMDMPTDGVKLFYSRKVDEPYMVRGNIYLPDLPPEQLATHFIHELKHANDYSEGNDENMTRDEAEGRANSILKGLTDDIQIQVANETMPERVDDLKRYIAEIKYWRNYKR